MQEYPQRFSGSSAHSSRSCYNYSYGVQSKQPYAPKYTFGVSRESMKDNSKDITSPGPGKYYSPLKTMGKDSPKYSIKGKYKNSFSIRTDSPGPAAYDPQTKMNERGVFGIAGYKNVKSYDFSMKNLYKKYYDKKSTNEHMCAKIYENINKIKLIESSIDGFIYVWDFHTAENLKIINCCKGIQLRGICIWNENNIFVGGDDNSIKLIDIKNGQLLKSLTGQSGTICTLYKMSIPQFGECLITGSNNYEEIKLWSE